MQLIKGVSSRWMYETHTKDFSWQEGYGAFTVGISQKGDTIAYIQSQPEHHRKRSFEEEFIAFLKEHDFECDPRRHDSIPTGIRNVFTFGLVAASSSFLPWTSSDVRAPGG